MFNRVFNIFKANISRAAIPKAAFIVLVVIYFFTHAVSAFGQTTRSKQEIAASLNAIYSLLLFDDTPGGPLSLSLNNSLNRAYGYNYGSGNYQEGIDILFSGQGNDVQICFNAVDIQSGELTVELNGNQIGGLSSGENCFLIPANQQLSENVFRLVHQNPGDRWGINTISLNLSEDTLLTLPLLDRSEWNDIAVKKVLEIFAYGGHPTAAQISVWANMSPRDAIKEMLNFQPHNFKLSPLAQGEKYPEPAYLDGTFWGFREYMSSDSSNLPIPPGNSEREGLGIQNYNTQSAWVRMTTTRGLNPFRQKIGFWETNYHLATNLEAGISHRQMTYYYDEIMNAHAAGLPYQRVIAKAAKSAAVATQYSHAVGSPDANSDDNNMWLINSDTGLGFCQCNEDFAREIHQLFFGILGDQDPEGGIQHHENVTIPETAKALTDMRLVWIPEGDNGRFPDVIDFQSEYHHTDTVYVLNQAISGNNAAQKIDAIAEVAIQHPESLANLPVIIISGLADDDLSASEISQIRAAWAAMSSKNFLEFIQAYAISELFHSPDRVKYFTTFDRFINVGNKLILNNTESLLDHYNIGVNWPGARGIAKENVAAFQPLYNVFGGQTGIEASDAPAVFENNYNRFTLGEGTQRRASCEPMPEYNRYCDNYLAWYKDWGSVIPKTGGVYTIENVSTWLWNRFISDNGKNYTQVERAHILSLMGTDMDLSQLNCVRERREVEVTGSAIETGYTPLELIERDNPWDSNTQRRCDYNFSAVEIELLEKGFTSEELEAPEMASLLNELGNRTLELDSSDLDTRRRANEEVGQAINFILSTPFIMAQEAR